MNKIVEIIIRWYIHKVAFRTGNQKMYIQSNYMSKIGALDNIFGSKF